MSSNNLNRTKKKKTRRRKKGSGPANKTIFTVHRLKIDVNVGSAREDIAQWEEIQLRDNGRSFLYPFAKIMHNTKGINKVTVGTHSRGRFNILVRKELSDEKPDVNEIAIASVQMRMIAGDWKTLRNENWVAELFLNKEQTTPTVHCSKHRTTTDLGETGRWEITLL